MTQQIIGKCGVCGGAVAIMGTWSAHPSISPPGSCLQCGRQTARTYERIASVPTFDMRPLEVHQNAVRVAKQATGDD